MKYKLLFLAVLFSAVSWGQSSIAAVATNYTQDFNGLASSGGPFTWTDNSTLAGWYAKTDLTASPVPTTYAINTGSSTSGALCSFGVAGTNAITERGFGIVAANGFVGTANGVRSGYYGWRLKNNTGTTLTSVTVTWTGEQWRKNGTATPQSLILAYQTSASAITDLTAGSWTAAGSTFTSPILTTTAINIDGNAPANRTAGITVTIAVSLPAGSEIMLRWADLNDGGNEHIMGIDDVTVKVSNANKVSAANGDWNTPATWTPVGVPTPTDNVEILAAHTVYTATSLTRTGTTIVNGGFQVDGGGYASGTGFIYAATGSSLIMNHNSGLYAISTGQVFWPTTNPPFNVTIQGTGAQINNPVGSVAGTLTVNSQLDCAVANALTITTTGTALINAQLNIPTAGGFIVNGVLQINASFINTNSPIYGNASTLKYNVGAVYGRGYEWLALGVGTIGTTAGYPNNVTLSNNTNLNYTNGTPLAKAMYGNLTVDLGSTFSMDYASVTAGGILTVRGDVAIAGTLRLGFASGDDLYMAGNLSFTGTGSLVGNDRAIFFTKTGTQTVSSVAALTIPFVRTSGTGTTVQLLSNLIISSSATGTNVLTFGNAADVIDINGQTLTIGTNTFSGVISGSGSFKGSATSNLTLNGTGNIGTVKFVTTLPTDSYLGTFVMNRTATGGCTMGSAVTVNTALTLTAGIINLGANTMTLETAVPLLISSSASNYVIADVSVGGFLRRRISQGGAAASNTYDFPIGSGGTQYTPATINFTSAAAVFTNAYIGIAVENSKDSPNLDASTHYINRYWDVTSSGTFSSTVYNFVGTYINNSFPALGDVSGTNTLSRANQWNGSAWLNNGGAGSVATGPPATITAPCTTLLATNRFTAGLRDREINIVQGTTQFVATGTPVYDFGFVAVGTPSVVTFTIQNFGQSTITLTNASPTMAGSATYTGGNYSAATVPIISGSTPGTRTFTITFLPTGAGTFTGSATVLSNDADEPSYVINFTGIGCPTTTVTATPTSGPPGTDVTITASVGDISGTTVSFNGIPATIVSSTATVLVVTVPNGAVSGSINITKTATTCITQVPFTIINRTGTCSGLDDLIMTEVYDHTSGALGYIEVYNGTGAPLTLSNYKIRRFGDSAALLANNYQDYTFPTLTTIANGTAMYGKLSTDADIASANFSFAGSTGINASDIFYLYNGTTVIDVYFVQTSVAGYTALRSVTTAGPNTASNPSDWTETAASTANLGSFIYSGSAYNVPTINTDPVDLTTCNLTASFSVTATASAGSLTYQWLYNSGLTAGWAAIAGGTFTGVTATGFASATLNLNGAIGTLTGYQFYCQVTQTGGCTVASDAAQITVSTATWNGLGWTNGPPSLTKQVILTGSYNMAAPLPSFEACSLYVNSPNVLTITSGNYVSVQNNITVVSTGNVLVKDDGSLVQISDSGVNTGSVTVERITSAKLEDYVYWSSPVANFPVTSISPSTSTSLIWKWNPTVNNSNNGQGSWVHPTFTPTPDNMAVGVGYIIKGLTGLNNTTFTDYLATFTGTPFNGVKQPGIARGNITTVPSILPPFPAAPYAGTNGATITQYSDNMNLMGNPYPSAVNAIKFLTLNTNIDGNVRLWTHGTSPSASTSPYYGSYGYNYAPGDYITYNVSGTSTGPSGFGGNIASGQGFFVTMNDGAFDATQTVTFNNAMRSNYSLITSTYSYYGNSNFYRNANAKTVIPQDIERHRIWLDLVSGDAVVSARTLVGYIEGATMEKDRLFDASTSVSSSLNLYSLITDKPYCIQGRALPFDSEDKVSLGVKLPVSGSYTIAIATTDGLFNETNQDIYLEDTALNIIHDLRQAPYVFTGESGRFDTRFILLYKNTSALGTVDFENLTNSVIVTTPNHNQIAIKSYIEDMKSVVVYDILGRIIYNNSKVNAKELTILNGVLNQQTLIVKTTLENGLVVTKKIVL